MPSPSHLTLVTSDSPGVLAERLALDLSQAPLGPFENEVIVVHNYGMRRWVRQELAARHGYAASLDVKFPGKFCRDVAKVLTGDDGSTDPRFTRDAMTWRILDLFEQGAGENPDFVAVHRFLGDGDTRKRLGLASRAAACLDDYQLYRPDVLALWEETEAAETASTNARWQHALWRHLCATNAPNGTFSRWMDRAAARLSESSDIPPGLPHRVSVFGVSSLPVHIVRLLQGIAKFIPVQVYVLAPPRASWADDTPANPLFAAFGDNVRELISLLGTDLTLEEHPTPSSTRTTCLGQLRDDVRASVVRGREPGMLPPIALDATDDSLTVHICHSPMREMEVLRDQIFAAFAADPTLRPHDVLVLVPDTTIYAPLVEAVFDVGEPDLPRIPHRVADRPIAHESSLTAAMLRILQLTGARWTVPEIVELLDVEAVRRAAGISDSGAQTILRWIDETRIRWGRDGAMRKNDFDLPAIDTNTWRAGIDRLLMGYATGRADDVIAGVLPHAGDTVGDPATLGTFAQWLDRLFDTLDNWRTPRTLSEWRSTLRDAVIAMLEPEGDDEDRAMTTLLGAIDTLGDAERDGAYHRTVDLGVAHDWIERSLSDEMMTGGFLTGGMVIAALKPMRAIPFRVIAVLGLDNESFPRSSHRAAYDLLSVERRPGDQDRRRDDRQLFLDTILAATDRLILSYVGRSARDNTERAASVALAELLDIVDASFTHPSDAARPARDAITVQHRLQPFSPAYYGANNDARLFSFSRVNARATAIMLADRNTIAPFVTQAVPADDAPTDRVDIQLTNLINCWVNPSAFFCKNVLGLRIDGDDEESLDCEPMTVNRLDSYKLQDEIVRRHLAGQRSIQHERSRATLLGDLPSGDLGALWFDRVDAELQGFLDAVGQTHFLEPEIVAVDGPSWRITGRIDRLTKDGRTDVRPAKRKPKDLIRAWITHLVLCASRVGMETTVYALDGKTCLPCVKDPMALLDELVSGYRAALRAPLPVFENASWSYVDRIVAQAKGTRATKTPLEMARSAYAPSEFGDMQLGDQSDAHIALCWRGRDPLEDALEDFDRYSRTLWSPILDCMRNEALVSPA
ncbi:MAG: exodeoxyribonuclease V subunit gamma [Gemmatimonadaceae bacterium]